MSKRIKILVFTLLAVVLTLGVAGGVALAQDEPATPQTPYEIFLDKLAANLDVSVDQLKAAFNEASEATLDEMVDQGSITEAQRDWALQRMEQYGDWATGYGWHGWHGMGGRFGGPFGAFAPPWAQAPTE